MDEPKKNIRDYSLKVLWHYRFIDTRILNSLHSYGLTSASQIYEFYLKRKGIYKIPGLGELSKKILFDFLNNFDENMQIIKDGEMRESVYDKTKREILYKPDLNVFDFEESKLLNIRCRNILIANDVVDINGLFLNYRVLGHFKRLRNCGEKSNEIILTFIKAIEPKLEQYKIDANG